MLSSPSYDQIRRRFAGLVAIVALLAQLLLPGLAQAQDGLWIEICSESGTVLMPVDLEEGGDDLPCPKCKDCVFCAAAAPGVSLTKTWLKLAPDAARSLSRGESEFGLVETRYQRPCTRGPPVVKDANTGEAPWI